MSTDHDSRPIWEQLGISRKEYKRQLNARIVKEIQTQLHTQLPNRVGAGWLKRTTRPK